MRDNFFVLIYLLSKRIFNFLYKFSRLLSPSLSRNKQNGMLSVSLCFITQSQHLLWLGQLVFGHTHIFTFLQPMHILLSASATAGAAAGWFFSGKPAVNYCCGATCPGVNFYRGGLAIQRAGATFHT